MTGAPAPRCSIVLPVLLSLLVALGLAFSLLRHLSFPLLWNDEAETMAYAQRILAFGYPKIWDGHNLIYELDAPLEVGRKKDSDAYVGSVWGQYYFGTLGIFAARGVDDLHARTFRFRLPFVLAGAAGLAAVAVVLAGSLSGRRVAAAWTVVGFLALALFSASLVLHLREARYHGLAVGLQGLLLLVHRRRTRPGSNPGLLSFGTMTLVLFLLFNVFPPAALAWAVALAIDVTWNALRDPEASETRRRRLAVGWAPLLAFGLLVLPLLRFYETLQIARYFSSAFRFDAGRWLGNVFILCDFLLWHEPLVAAIAIKVVAETLAAPIGQIAPGPAGRLRLSRLISLAALLELLAVSRIPFVFERYALAALPLLAASLVLDAGLALDLARSLPSRRRHATQASLAAALLMGLCLLVPAKRDELRGRWAELREPVRGPLDFVLPRLKGLREDPSTLVVATNYEACAYIVYLGSRTLVGFTGLSFGSTPDVIVPRKGVPRFHRELAAYLVRDRYVRETFPVTDLPFNNIPELTPGPGLGVLHQFRTPVPLRDGDLLEIWVRADLVRVPDDASR